jgi:hypothetical protein
MSQIPPTQFDGSTFREPARWPKVVGIISIVWGSLGLLCGGCGVASPFLTSFATQGAEAQMGEPFPAVMQPSGLQIMLYVATLPISVLLIIAGATCVGRKKITSPLHLVYAAVSALLTLLLTYAGIVQNAEIEAWTKQNPNSKWLQGPGGGSGTRMFMMLVGLILGLAYPAFCIIWFAIIKRKTPDLGTPNDDADADQATAA